MKNSSLRDEKKTDAEKEALTYWFVGVIFTLLPTLISIGAAWYLSKPLAASNDEIAMLACLVLLPTLLDYFREGDKSDRVHAIYFAVLVVFLIFYGAIYGIAKANDQKEVTFVSVFLMVISIFVSYVAEMVLRGRIKVDIMILQAGLSAFVSIFGVIVGVITLLMDVIGRKSAKSPEKTIDIFVNGRKVKAANLKADDIAALVNKLDAEEVAALKERMKQSDKPTEEE